MSSSPSKPSPPAPKPAPNTKQHVTHLQEQVVDVLEPYVGEDKAPMIAAQITQVVKSESFSGPLPHPKHLADYEKVHKGAANRILKMTEADLAHRHECNRAIIKAETGFMLRGQIFAMTALIIMLAATILFVMTGHEVAGALVGGVTLVGIVTAFLNRNKARANAATPEE